MDEQLRALLDAAARREAPPLEEAATLSELPIQGGYIRAFHARPATVEAARPVVMVPGFGTLPSGWHDWWAPLYDRAEVFYIETREKPRSVMAETPDADLSMQAFIRDIAQGLDHYGLVGRDCAYIATSWGATAAMAAMAEGVVDMPGLLAWNPVDHMWFNRWSLKHLTPRIPFSVIDSLRGVISGVALAGMAPAQRERLMGFINAADWRWKAAAEAQVDFDLSAVTHRIQQEVRIVVGVDERVHSSEVSAALTASLPRGRLLAPQVPETENTRLAGIACLELARSVGEALPPLLAGWERDPTHSMS